MPIRRVWLPIDRRPTGRQPWAAPKACVDLSCFDRWGRAEDDGRFSSRQARPAKRNPVDATAISG